MGKRKVIPNTFQENENVANINEPLKYNNNLKKQISITLMIAQKLKKMIKSNEPSMEIKEKKEILTLNLVKMLSDFLKHIGYSKYSLEELFSKPIYISPQMKKFVKTYISKGYDINIFACDNLYSYHPILWFVVLSQDVDLFNYLLKKGFDINKGFKHSLYAIFQVIGNKAGSIEWKNHFIYLSRIVKLIKWQHYSTNRKHITEIVYSQINDIKNASIQIKLFFSQKRFEIYCNKELVVTDILNDITSKKIINELKKLKKANSQDWAENQNLKGFFWAIEVVSKIIPPKKSKNSTDSNIAQVANSGKSTHKQNGSQSTKENNQQEWEEDIIRFPYLKTFSLSIPSKVANFDINGEHTLMEQISITKFLNEKFNIQPQLENSTKITNNSNNKLIKFPRQPHPTNRYTISEYELTPTLIYDFSHALIHILETHKP